MDKIKPYRRPVLHPTYGCAALTVRGRRCGRPHYTEYPVTFSWDPIKGVGVGGPHIPLCRMHGYLHELERHERIQIVGGWMGAAWNPDAKVWTVLTTVYETKDGLDASKHWWALRYDAVFGDCYRETYDEAVARLATLDNRAVAV